MSIILLEHPRPRTPERCESVVNTPLSACLMTGFVASMLKSHQYDVEIVDANLYGWSFHRTVQELERKKFSLIGVHLVYLWQNTEDVFEALLKLRNSSGRNAHINLYGHFPTFAFRELLTDNDFVDSVTLGEPEFTFLELADAVLNNKDIAALKTIDGLAFNSHNNSILFNKVWVKEKHSDARMPLSNTKPEIIVNKPRKPVSNPDILPFPYRYDFSLFKKKGISTYILASRGCYGKCTFCYLDNFYGDKSLWRGRSPENIVKEISQIYENHGERYFYFADANFFGPGKRGKSRVCELAHLLMRNGLDIKFGIECRVNDIDEKTAGILVKAGLKDVFLGIESGSQRSLHRFRKLTTVEDNKSAIKVLRHHGIEPNYGFIMFEPDSTLVDIRDNFEFLKEMKMLRSPSITAHLLHHKQTVFKGTPDYEEGDARVQYVAKPEYETVYEFKDKVVGALSEGINSFCLQALQDISRNRGLNNGENDSCVYDENDLFSQEINEMLITRFEQALSFFEKERDRPDSPPGRICLGHGLRKQGQVHV